MIVEVVSVEPFDVGKFRITYRITVGATVFTQEVVLKQTIALEVVEATAPVVVAQ